MPAMGGLSLYYIQRLIVLLLCLVHHLNPSLAYSLKNCSICYSNDASADVVLHCSERKLVTVPDDIPRDASIVYLSHNQLKQINRDDFRDLSKLRVLSLDENQIAHVDDGSFIHLVALTRLHMANNKLTDLTGNLFQGMSNLTMLDLSRNNITSIHTSAFQSLSRLETVILDSNKLQQVADIQPVLKLPLIQKLSITGNLFPSFETKDLLLNEPSSLKVLDFSNNVFEKFSITTKIFPHLEMIDFSMSGQVAGWKWDILDKTLLRNITQLYFNCPYIAFEEIRKVLQSLDSLMHLRLNYMDKWIDKGLLATVCEIPTLKKLDLYWNKVPNISAKLVTCSQLSELDLSSTSMTELSKGSIRLMKQLISLTLVNNLLTKVPDDIRSLSSLEILNIGINTISELSCGDFTNTTRLRELYLYNNHIAKLDRCIFESLNDLKVLDMSDNLMLTFGGAFKIGLKKLEFLDLSNNLVVILEKGDFQSLRSLKYLDMVSKHIRRVKHKSFDGLNNLGNLSVSLPLCFENKFRALQQLENLTIYFDSDIICKGDHSGFPYDIPMDMLQAMRHLEELTAENFYISAPDVDTFKYNRQLKSLTIRQTDLSDLDPGLFQPMPHLQVLDFSETKIKSLDFLFQANLSAVRCLKLSDNEINVINETVFQFLPALTYLDLKNNPFTCDCSNAGFIQWVKNSNQTQVVNAYQYTCSFPVAEQGNKLLDFNILSCWIDISFLCFISSTCLVVLFFNSFFLFFFFLHFFFWWQLAYAYRLFLAFLYDSRKRKGGTRHLYDAFISYNVDDEAWVYQEMLPALEGEQGWRLCLHHRDFQPGKPIVENITDAIYGSRKTICVITRRYLQSEWCSREIQMASFRLFDEQKDVLVLLFLEEIPAHQLSPYYRMRKLVKKRTYLSWPQAGQHMGVFWQNVGRALETGDAPTETADLLTGPAGC
ncbi:LOW QUALITY PROTEIN: toll-like receptor 13 [Perca fluviatilis]|uniref:LOW QUALITY PROTEIN: toll-like receptor 13 n=1 Tax=Perca fluviatilis TaxID=8168 RepID=UPI001966BECE|nr:LOW QUALITY PROTEIN: toll-like receptor 13 [Perca fluviatilis]